MDPSSPFAHHFGTNYIPDGAEVLDIKELINGRQVVVDGIDEEIAELDKRRKDLLEKRKAEVAHIDNHRALISLARRLHPDIILSIFLELVSTFEPCDHLRRPPAITLSQVCRQWRDLALNSPLVWAYIDMLVLLYPVKPSESPTQEDLKAYDKRLSQWMKHMDGLCTMADVFTARSQGCPLHISFAAEDPAAQGYPEVLLNEGGWCRVAEPLMTIKSKGTNEWKSLSLNLTITGSPMSLLLDMIQLPTLKNKGLQVLNLDVAYKDLDAGTGGWGAFQEQIDIQQAPLTSLKLLMPYIGLSKIYAQWDRLVSISIGTSVAGDTFNPQDAILVLSITPNIVFCTIQFSSDADRKILPQQPPVSLHKLRELNIYGPVLHNDFSTLLDTPSLLHLSVIHERASPCQEGRSAIVDWVNRFGKQLTHVALSYSSLTQSGFTYVLEHLPVVESLDLQGNDNNRSVNLFLGLGPRRKKIPTILGPTLLRRLTPECIRSPEDPNSFESCICPKLRSLICNLEEGHSEGTKDLILDMVEARRKIGRKDGPIAWIEKVDVTFKVGPVDGMLKDLKQRGVETYGVRFKARYANAHSTPCVFDVAIPGVGTIEIVVPQDGGTHADDNAHGHGHGHSHSH